MKKIFCGYLPLHDWFAAFYSFWSSSWIPPFLSFMKLDYASRYMIITIKSYLFVENRTYFMKFLSVQLKIIKYKVLYCISNEKIYCEMNHMSVIKNNIEKFFQSIHLLIFRWEIINNWASVLYIIVIESEISMDPIECKQKKILKVTSFLSISSID